MMSFTADGQLNHNLLESRDKEWGVSTSKGCYLEKWGRSKMDGAKAMVLHFARRMPAAALN